MNVPQARQACLTQVSQALVVIENRVGSLTRYKYPVLIPFPLEKKRRCLYCNSNNALEDCLPLRWKPYQEIIQFLASNKLYLGCLSNQHISRLCPQRKTCEIANCSRKHRSILHTSPGEKHTTDVGVGTDDNVDAQVRSSMVNIARMPNVRPYTKVAGQSWL